MKCCLTRIGDALYRCQACGWTWTDRHGYGVLPDRQCKPQPTPPRRERRANEPTDEPDLAEAAADLGITLAMVRRYAVAVARWTAAGRPKRSDEDVARIWTEHCEPCEHRVRHRCRLCGCRVAGGGVSLTLKPRMATEHCAAVPPRW